MENNYYQIYLDSTFDFVEGIVLKSKVTATMINDGLYIKYGPSAYDEFDPSSWKYYLNLAGEYHPSDKEMRVVSMDTLEEIVFNKANLLVHRATAHAYEYGTKHFDELVSLYPEQYALIFGVQRPVDIALAIDAPDGTILTYPLGFIEPQEYSLIEEIQKWLYGFFARWDNVQFNNSDNLYHGALLAIAAINLVPAVATHRLKKCKTNEAHTYHIHQYLASHSKLAEYMDYMTLEQKLFFYRNAAYIERNSGQTENFDWLVWNVLTKRRLPLAYFEMRHNTEKQTIHNYPTLSFKKLPINTQANVDMINDFSLDIVLDKEDPIAFDNPLYRESDEALTRLSMLNSLDNNLDTKLLECSVIDYTGSEKYTFGEIALMHWLYFAFNGTYTPFIPVTIPATGEQMVLSAKDAFIFYLYAYTKTYARELTHLPKVAANRVQRIPASTLADVKALVETSRVSDEWITELISTMTPVVRLTSIESFFDHCTALFVGANAQWGMVSYEERMRARGQKQNAAASLWCDSTVDLSDTPGVPQSFDAWFASRGISIVDFTLQDLEQMSAEMLANATGMNSSKNLKLESIQKAMVKLLLQLSSYTIQCSTTINAGPIGHGGIVAVRVDDIGIKTRTLIRDDLVPVDVIAHKVDQHSKAEIDLGSGFLKVEIGTAQHSAKRHLISSIPRAGALLSKGMDKYTFRLDAGLGFSIDIPQSSTDLSERNYIFGMKEFLLLTPEQQRSVPSAW